MKSIRALFAVGSIALACGAAQAADYNSFLDLGLFDDSTSAIGNTFRTLRPADVNSSGKLIAAHSFESVIEFTLSYANDSNGSVTLSNNRNFNLSITDVSLFKVGMPGALVDTDPAADTFAFDGLAAGTYGLHVSGTLSAGFKGGSWGGNLNTQSVPEPQTYGLMLLGLAGLAAVARRRRRAG